MKLDEIIFPEGGSYLWGALAGSSHAAKRQKVMELLGHKLPRSKCGYNLVRDSLLKHFDIGGFCPAVLDDMLVNAIKTEGRK